MKLTIEDVCRWLIKSGFNFNVPQGGDYSDFSGPGFYIAPIFMPEGTVISVFAGDGSVQFTDAHQMAAVYGGRGDLLRRLRDRRVRRVMEKAEKARQKARLEKAVKKEGHADD